MVVAPSRNQTSIPAKLSEDEEWTVIIDSMLLLLLLLLLLWWWCAQLYGKSYYQPEHYVSKRMLERMALPTMKDELPRLHARHVQMLPEEAEIEYLKVRGGAVTSRCKAHRQKTHAYLLSLSLLRSCGPERKPKTHVNNDFVPTATGLINKNGTPTDPHPQNYFAVTKKHQY